jgi:transcriptional regulator with XRE-family HTH domain
MGHPEPKRPHKVIAERVREVRSSRGLTAARLAERMQETGISWDRSVVANLENGRRASVTVEELLALAFVLDVAPVHLVVPLTPDGWLAITPDASTTNEHARAWIRGNAALPGGDERKFFSEVPEDEWKRRVEQQQEFERQLAEAGIITKVGPDGEVRDYDRESGKWVKREEGSP